jgi:hypothetical protein
MGVALLCCLLGWPVSAPAEQSSGPAEQSSGPAEQSSGLGCISEIALPVYGSLPWLAQITGTARVTIHLDTSGKPVHLDVHSPHKALTDWVKGMLTKSSFLGSCGGQTVHLVFKYRLDGERREAPDNHVVVKSPGTFEITASPPALHQIVN